MSSGGLDRADRGHLLGIFHASALVGISTVANLAAGLLRAKLTAVWIGATGIGLVSQAQNVSLMVGSLMSLGVGTGLLACSARAHGEHRGEEISALTDSAITIMLVPAVLTIACRLVAGRALDASIFGNGSSSPWTLDCALVGGMAAALQTLPGSLLYAHGRVRTYVAASLVSTALGALLLVVLLLAFGVLGAIVHVALAPTVVLIVVTLAARRELPAEVHPLGRWPLRPSWNHVRSLLGFATYGTLSGVTYYGSQVIGRSIFLGGMGLGANGVLQAAVAIGSYFRQIVSGGLTADLFPRAARTDSDEEVGSLLWGAQRYLLAVALPLAATLALFGGLAIPLLYSREFAPAAEILPVYLAAEVLRLLAVAAMMILMARRLLWAASIPVVAGEFLFIGTLLITPHGMAQYAIAWLCGGLASLITAFLILYVTLHPAPRWKVLGLTFSLPLAVAIVFPLLPANYVMRASLTAGMAVIAWRWGLMPSEQRMLVERAKAMRWVTGVSSVSGDLE